MEPWVIISVAVALLVVLLILGFLLIRAESKNSLATSALMGRSDPQPKKVQTPNVAMNLGQQPKQTKQAKHFGADEGLRKRLKYAGWTMEPIAFKAMQIGSGCLCALLMVTFGFGVKILWLPFGFMTGWIISGSFLEKAIYKRFKNFDNDYPNVLLSLVGLLRTGMNPMQGLAVAVESLGDQSLLRLEVLMMNERLKYGVSEDMAIGMFAENIDHSEIELFVQALILSRKLGGTLSDTLERLSKQVRKRQFFRASAISAVSLQKGSVWVILGILVGLLGYILVIYPALVTEGFKLPMGEMIWQIGIMLMLTGIWWVRQITKIKV
jgi:Flp pilus assembly protein TadB